MKYISVLISIAVTACGVTTAEDLESLQQSRHEQTKKEGSSDYSFVSLLPLKILLEHQLKAGDFDRNLPERDFQYKISKKKQEDSKNENFKSLPTIQKEGNQENDFCSEINLTKNLSEISNILNKNINDKESSINKEQMQKIYNSLKDCFYLKIGNAKLWGPLWHCLNRLFLFFIFH